MDKIQSQSKREYWQQHINAWRYLATELSQFNPHSATPAALAAQVSVWAEQVRQLQQEADLVARQRHEIHFNDIKIAALTLELAYHKRIKFSSTSEVFTAQQRDLFDETQETDLNAMLAELDELSTAPRAKTKPTGRKPLPAELPRIEHRHEPESCSCGAFGQALVKIGEPKKSSYPLEAITGDWGNGVKFEMMR